MKRRCYKPANKDEHLSLPRQVCLTCHFDPGMWKRVRQSGGESLFLQKEMISTHRTSCFSNPPPRLFFFSPRKKIARSDSQNETRGAESCGDSAAAERDPRARGMRGLPGPTPFPSLRPENRGVRAAPGASWLRSPFPNLRLPFVSVIVFTARRMRCWRLSSLYRALKGCFGDSLPPIPPGVLRCRLPAGGSDSPSRTAESS